MNGSTSFSGILHNFKHFQFMQQRRCQLPAVEAAAAAEIENNGNKNKFSNSFNPRVFSGNASTQIKVARPQGAPKTILKSIKTSTNSREKEINN